MCIQDESATPWLCSEYFKGEGGGLLTSLSHREASVRWEMFVSFGVRGFVRNVSGKGHNHDSEKTKKRAEAVEAQQLLNGRHCQQGKQQQKSNSHDDATTACTPSNSSSRI